MTKEAWESTNYETQWLELSTEVLRTISITDRRKGREFIRKVKANPTLILECGASSTQLHYVLYLMELTLADPKNLNRANALPELQEQKKLLLDYFGRRFYLKKKQIIRYWNSHIAEYIEHYNK